MRTLTSEARDFSTQCFLNKHQSLYIDSTMASLQKIVKLVYNPRGMIIRDQLDIARDILERSGVIALPTDTLYGITARADDSKALERIYKIKGRDPNKPLAVCIPDVTMIEDVADIGKTSMTVLKSLLPGPITVVSNRSKNLNKDLNPSIDTIGVRVPNHNFVMALCDLVGPLALTSANKSGGKSPISIDDFEDIWDELDCIFDSGPISQDVTIGASNRTGSTVIDLTNQEKKYYKIIREGCALNRTINTLTRYGYSRKH